MIITIYINYKILTKSICNISNFYDSLKLSASLHHTLLAIRIELHCMVANLWKLRCLAVLFALVSSGGTAYALDKIHEFNYKLL
jgi:hypothetical protein